MRGRSALAVTLATVLLGACVTIDRVSTSTRGAAVNADTTAVASSASGRYVAFQTAATDVVSDETNGQPHVYRKDRTTGAVVNVDRRGALRALRATNPAISADGNLVAFVTTSALVAADVNGVADVYVRDVGAGHTTLASVLSDGSLLAADQPAIRADFDGGSRIVWQAEADSPFSYLFLRDLAAGTTTLVDGPGFWDSLDLSADGNHVTGTGNCGTPRVCQRYVYVKDLAAPYLYTPQYCDGATLGGQSADGRFVLVNRSAACGGTPALYDRNSAAWLDVTFGPTSGTHAVALSGDGLVALVTASDAVLPGGTTGFVGLFARRIASGKSERVGVNVTRQPGDASQRPEDGYGISADGAVAVFTSAATNLVPGDDNGHVDGFARVLSRSTVATVG